MRYYSYPIFINLTKRCNFFCDYCYNDSSNNNESSSYVLDNWLSIVNQITHTGIKEIRLSGGEPFLIDNIEEICQYISSNNLTYTVTTNGSLLLDNQKWLKNNPPDTLWLSFHSKYYSLKTFESLISSINLPQTKLGINIFYTDILNQPDLLSLFSNEKIHRFKILNKTILGRNNLEELKYNLDDIKSYFRLHVGKHKPEVRIELPLIKDELVGINSCLIKSRPLITIDNNGKIYNCCITINEKSSTIGNLSETDLCEILENIELRTKCLPCKTILPKINLGKDSCPLFLIKL